MRIVLAEDGGAQPPGERAVYQAMDENLSCVVAVKETFAATDKQRRAFRREAERRKGNEKKSPEV